jgi:hypothetical protein
LWPTPRADDGRGAGGLSHARREAGRKPDTLSEVIRAEKLWPTPLAQDAKNNGNQSGRHSTELNAAVGGSLNPAWVEWLMGYEIGYTDLED